MINKKSISYFRAEAIVAFFIAILASVYFWRQIDWVHYFLLFWVIDIFGYWPGLLFAKFSGRQTPPEVFYYAYNFFHSVPGMLLIALLYTMITGQAYATIALIVHMFIDRGILGNTLKNPAQPFAMGKF